MTEPAVTALAWQSLLLALALGSAALGFALLALALPRHWEDSTGERVDAVPARRAMRGAGASLLVLSLAACLLRDGASFGALLWVLILFGAAAGVALVLAWVPQWLLPLARRVSAVTGT